MGFRKSTRRGFIAAATGVTGAIGLEIWSHSQSAVLHPPVAACHPPAVLKEIILELVSTAENSTKRWTSSYPYIQDIGDGRGYTAGIVGWCSGTGDMLVLVEDYALSAPGNPLQRFLPALRQIMDVPFGRRPALSHALLDPGFSTAWATASSTAGFQAAQRSQRDLMYWEPAGAAANADRLSPLGHYIYFDGWVNHGPGSDAGSFGGIIDGVKANGHRSPAQGGNEGAYLMAIIAARDAVLKSWGAYQVNGRSTIGLRFLREMNLNLSLPLAWTVYGNAYSITKAPIPALRT